MSSPVIKAYKELYIYVKPYKLLVFALFLLTILVAPARLMFSPILKFIFDEVFSTEKPYNVALRNLHTVILVIIGITIIQSIINTGRYIFSRL